ncbi:MFS transporter [Sphingomonas naphthae]|uniref:MFS transporter n=1 Tax=Sphingomonas naphthae TaxID=1813468 RepID=A0ABY7TM26_9SPHN|nr:MFS transporter [Sphingomonas naphthae]WCT73450.1 MFS transporter [Sphingomonas naphthae]
MGDAAHGQSTTGWAALQPLRDKTFRSIWSASVLSNFGQLVLGVAAAWEMTRLASPEMVALVQTALMLPLMLVAVPAGAIADMFDRRKIAMAGLAFSTLAAATLTVLATLGLAGPWVLLAFCFLIGGGVALYSPAWQSSISEQVPAAHLPAAVSLGAVSYNIARSFGPAVGGAVVLAFGAKAAFATNALMYLPLLGAFYLWRRQHATPRLPPERLHRAIVSGLRYALHAPSVRVVMVRAAAFGTMSAGIAALTPLVARDLLHGNAGTYGLLLGATGIGSVGGALMVSDVRERLSPEAAVRIAMAVMGAMAVVAGLSHHLLLTAAALAIAGAASMLTISMLNVSVQLSVPRWVAARSLAWYQSSLTGGIAFGSWAWGAVTADHGVGIALMGSGVGMLLLPLLGLVIPIAKPMGDDTGIVEISHEPEVALAITARSGPVIVEIDYRVDPDEARIFYDAMLGLQGVRLRNGAFDWSIARDIADAALWTERFHFPTWQDYLRQRTRFTHADRTIQAVADRYNSLTGPGRVRRRLERPLGSVRWRAETPDPRNDTAIGLISP